MSEKVIMIEVSLKEYNKLLDADIKLGALESMGVDNWCGYDDAMDEYRKWKEEDDLVVDTIISESDKPS